MIGTVTSSPSDTFPSSPELELTSGPTDCDPDINGDGNIDQDDVQCIIDAVAGNPGCLSGSPFLPDFNQDGNEDQEDVAAVINAVAGGGCPNAWQPPL